jgi:DNA-binding LytR/AlgR family response regulator
MLRDYAAVNHLTLDVTCFSSGEALLANYRPLLYTVIVLDIYMEDMSGIETAERIRAVDSDVLLVFLTTSDDHRPETFRCHAFDYIRKPVDTAALFQVMDDILKRNTPPLDKHLAFTSNRREYRLPYSDIVVIRSNNHYLEILDRQSVTYMTRMTFSSVSDLLKQDRRFLLILRGVYVNMDYIIDFRGNTCYLTGDIHLPINVRNSRKIQQIWRNYLFQSIRGEATERGARR